MKLLLLILALTVTTYGQTDLNTRIKTFKHHKSFAVEHDKFTDLTTVTAGPFDVDVKETRYVKGRFSVYAQIIFSGNKPTLMLGVSAHADDWHFLKSPTLYVLHDGQRTVLEAQRGSRIRKDHQRYGFLLNEWLVAKVDESNLRSISESSSVEIKTGQIEFKLTEKHLQSFRDLLTLVRRS